MWTIDTAKSFLEKTAAAWALAGISVTIIGSVSAIGRSDKDLDLLAAPIHPDERIELSEALSAVFKHFLPGHTVDHPQSVEPLPTDEPYPQTFINLGLVDGRTVEIYFPESMFPIG